MHHSTAAQEVAALINTYRCECFYVCICVSASIYVSVRVFVAAPHFACAQLSKSFQIQYEKSNDDESCARCKISRVRGREREGRGTHILKIGMWRVKGKGKAFALIKNN